MAKRKLDEKVKADGVVEELSDAAIEEGVDKAISAIDGMMKDSE